MHNSWYGQTAIAFQRDNILPSQAVAEELYTQKNMLFQSESLEYRQIRIQVLDNDWPTGSPLSFATVRITDPIFMRISRVLYENISPETFWSLLKVGHHWNTGKYVYR